MLKFHSLEEHGIPWESLDGFEDRVVFQTRPWLEFVAEAQNARPVVAEVRDGAEVAGYFSGLVVQKFGVKILGSTFPGWTTPYIGFNLKPRVSRREALRALEPWAFGELGCMHFEVSDLRFQLEDGAELGYESTFYDTYHTDLTLSEDELFKNMESACRRCIRKAEKSGVVVEEAHDAAFADEYHAQLVDVFAKQGRVPSYGVERVRTLIHHLLPTGNLLLLRARDAEGRCIATGIYPGYKDVAEFWGNASWRAYQQVRPNETLHWYAMRYWKARGARIFDWGGGGTYKEKYGVTPVFVPWFYKSRYKFISTLRNEARSLYYRGQKWMGTLKGKRAPVPVGDSE